MDQTAIIPLSRLWVGFLPLAVVIYFHFKWQIPYKNALYATGRMLIQLLLIGYFLIFIFGLQGSVPVMLVLSVMALMATWISLNSLKKRRKDLFLRALGAVAFSGSFTLLLMIKGVLDLSPWSQPSVIIPLAGMTFANAMNSVSLAGERFFAEQEKGGSFEKCRQAAFQAAMIPITNSLMAVGLVSLPGMMTGQILAGVSPLIAARYQIMIMSILFGAMGLAAILFLQSLKKSSATSP